MTDQERIEQLEGTLEDIGRLALSCWMDMQGRLVDDEHHRAHRVLGSIIRQSAGMLPEEPNPQNGASA